MSWSPLADRIAAELEGMAAATEQLAEALCSDDEVAQRCLPLLQQFDLLAQQQLELAGLIGRLGEGAGAEEAVRAIRLAALADRLGRAA